MPESIISMMAAKWWLSKSIISFTFTSWLCAVRKSFLFICMYPYMYVVCTYISLWTHTFLYFSKGYNKLLSYYFYDKISKVLVGRPSGWFICPTSISPHYSLRTSFFFVTKRYFKLKLYCPCHRLLRFVSGERCHCF